jgi:hypothetical protein
VALVASAAASGFALVWIAIARDNLAAATAATLLFLGELTAIIATARGASPPFAAIVITHTVNLAALLALTWNYWWRQIALWAVLPACGAAAANGGTAICAWSGCVCWCWPSRCTRCSPPIRSPSAVTAAASGIPIWRRCSPA